MRLCGYITSRNLQKTWMCCLLKCCLRRSCWHAVRKVKVRSRTAWKWCSASRRKPTTPCTCLCWRVRPRTAQTHLYTPTDATESLIPSFRIWWKHWLPGRADTPGILPGLGSQDSYPKGSWPTPLPVWDVPGLQQRSQRFQRAQQIPLQEQALCKRSDYYFCSLFKYHSLFWHQLYPVCLFFSSRHQNLELQNTWREIPASSPCGWAGPQRLTTKLSSR